jgi:hypothetical protein
MNNPAATCFSGPSTWQRDHLYFIADKYPDGSIAKRLKRIEALCHELCDTRQKAVDALRAADRDYREAWTRAYYSDERGER